MRSLGWALIQRGKNLDMDSTQKQDAVKTHREDGERTSRRETPAYPSLMAPGRNQPCSHLDLISGPRSTTQYASIACATQLAALLATVAPGNAHRRQTVIKCSELASSYTHNLKQGAGIKPMS